MLTAYNANIDTTVQLLNAAFSTLSRFQHLQAERGEQVLLLAGKTMSALSRADGQGALPAQPGLRREALDSIRSYWEQVLMLSDEARREVLQLVERQRRFDGIALQSPVATHTRHADIADVCKSSTSPRRSSRFSEPALSRCLLFWQAGGD